MKTFFNLKAPYEGLRARRLAQCGRLILYQILNDPPRYWLIYLQNYKPCIDGPAYGWFIRNTHIPSEAPGRHFLVKEEAQTKFESLSKLPCCLTDEGKAQKSRNKRKQRLLDSGRAFQKKTE